MGRPKKIITESVGDGRVETGGIQFNDDWPGLFIRGDSCAALLLDIDCLLKDDAHPLCSYQLRTIKALIEEEVLYNTADD